MIRIGSHRSSTVARHLVVKPIASADLSAAMVTTLPFCSSSIPSAAQGSLRSNVQMQASDVGDMRRKIDTSLHPNALAEAERGLVWRHIAWQLGPGAEPRPQPPGYCHDTAGTIRGRTMGNSNLTGGPYAHQG